MGDLLGVVIFFGLLYLLHRWTRGERTTRFWQGLCCIFAGFALPDIFAAYSLPVSLGGDRLFVSTFLLSAWGLWRIASVFWIGAITEMTDEERREFSREISRRFERDRDAVMRPLRWACHRLHPQTAPDGE